MWCLQGNSLCYFLLQTEASSCLMAVVECQNSNKHSDSGPPPTPLPNLSGSYSHFPADNNTSKANCEAWFFLSPSSMCNVKDWHVARRRCHGVLEQHEQCWQLWQCDQLDLRFCECSSLLSHSVPYLFVTDTQVRSHMPVWINRTIWQVGDERAEITVVNKS